MRPEEEGCDAVQADGETTYNFEERAGVVGDSSARSVTFALQVTLRLEVSRPHDL